MGPLYTPLRSCLRQDYKFLVEEILVLFIPLVRVNDTGFETSAEGLENFFLF